VARAAGLPARRQPFFHIRIFGQSVFFHGNARLFPSDSRPPLSASNEKGNGRETFFFERIWIIAEWNRRPRSAASHYKEQESKPRLSGTLETSSSPWSTACVWLYREKLSTS
jgi:hypothetical protein